MIDPATLDLIAATVSQFGNHPRAVVTANPTIGGVAIAIIMVEVDPPRVGTLMLTHEQLTTDPPSAATLATQIGCAIESLTQDPQASKQREGL